MGRQPIRVRAQRTHCLPEQSLRDKQEPGTDPGAAIYFRADFVGAFLLSSPALRLD
jgi:hypothetical protein